MLASPGFAEFGSTATVNIQRGACLSKKGVSVWSGSSRAYDENMSEMSPHEQAFVEVFVQPPRRERAAFCLSNPKKRHEFINKVAHHGRDVLISEHLKSIDPSRQNPKSIYNLLHSLGAPSTCHVISTHISGNDIELLSALERVVGCGHGAVICCIPGPLGYFEGECKNASFWRMRSVNC